MATNNNNGEDITYKKSIYSHINNTIRRDLVKKLLEDSFKNSEISNDALSLVVELANCIVVETCIRASDEVLSGDGDDVKEINYGHVLECLPQLMLDFP